MPTLRRDGVALSFTGCLVEQRTVAEGINNLP
jgi:hypothetical protein